MTFRKNIKGNREEIDRLKNWQVMIETMGKKDAIKLLQRQITVALKT